MRDIEEAPEDAIGGGEDARDWWRRKGVDFNANDKEWMKQKSRQSPTTRPAECLGGTDEHAHGRAPTWDRFLNQLPSFSSRRLDDCVYFPKKPRHGNGEETKGQKEGTRQQGAHVSLAHAL